MFLWKMYLDYSSLIWSHRISSGGVRSWRMIRSTVYLFETRVGLAHSWRRHGISLPGVDVIY